MKQNLLIKLSSLLSFCLILSLSSTSQYCIPDANCTVGDGVVEFGIGPFYNTSGCGSDAGTPGYSDFTSLTGLSLAPGVTYDGSFRSDFGSQQFSIWIDSDNSESFETSELILTDLAVGTDLVIAPVTLPVGLALGDYRLRIMATYANPSSPNACDVNSTWGETEDYIVTIIEPPTCINVSALNLDAVSATTATISWTDPGTATVWDIEFGPMGFTPTGEPSPGMDNVSNPFTIEDLSPVTEYDVYIRADCGEDNVTDVSVWTSPFTFVTACGAVIPDYYEDFTDGLGNCWETYGSGDLTTGPLDDGFSNWFDNGFANLPGVFSGSQGIFMFGSNVNNWIVSPDFDLTAGPYQTEFDLAMTAGGFGQELTLGSDDEFFFLISTDFGLSWDTLGYWNEDEGVDPLGEHFAYDLSEYTGEFVRFAYYTTNGVNDDFMFYQVFVDNFRVQGLGAPLEVNIDLIVEPNCFQFGGNPLADVIISVSGGTAPYTFEWSDGTETEDLLDAEPGIVTVTVTDSEGQTFTSDEIVVPGTPVLT
ncbi:MAG: hypothetical protein HKO93_03465, partial [Flavobacteriales bacterium]|nr:hypothetical protein [Flavobacteriales bacterium]